MGLWGTWFMSADKTKLEAELERLEKDPIKNTVLIKRIKERLNNIKD